MFYYQQHNLSWDAAETHQRVWQAHQCWNLPLRKAKHRLITAFAVLKGCFCCAGLRAADQTSAEWYCGAACFLRQVWLLQRAFTGLQDLSCPVACSYSLSKRSSKANGGCLSCMSAYARLSFSWKPFFMCSQASHWITPASNHSLRCHKARRVL